MTYDLQKNWGIIEDIHCLGELYEIYKFDFDPRIFGSKGMKTLSPWQPIDKLEHLQLTLAENPYYGFGLRQFNASPWWYRNEFEIEEPVEHAVLHFTGVDYFADVWLNETHLGSHEGYNTPFSFEVGNILKQGKNLLVVKVRAPFDCDYVEGHLSDRFLFVLRDQMKGTHEHSDTFLPRDVNPLGIWDTVKVELYSGLRTLEKPRVASSLCDDCSQAEISAQYKLHSEIACGKADATVCVCKAGDPRVLAKIRRDISIEKGVLALSETLTLENPQLWTVWERGYPHRYEVTLEIKSEAGNVLLYYCDVANNYCLSFFTKIFSKRNYIREC